MAPNTTSLTAKKIYPIVSSSEVSERGKVKEVLCDGFYYDVTDWVKKHPGGKVINYYTQSGEDATVAIQQFHNHAKRKVTAILRSLSRRPASDSEIGLDPETLKRHRALTADFTKLHFELEAEGYFNPSVLHIAYRILEVIIFASLGCFLFSFDSLWVKTMGLLSFAMFKGRCGWLQHECGHHSLTGHPRVDKILTAVLMGVGDGLSASCWFSQHQAHHAMPQRLQRDVDLDTLPFIAFNAKITKYSKFGKGQNFFVRNQAVLFITIDTFLVGLMWKLYLHPRYAYLKGKYFELCLMALSNGFIYFIGFWPYLAAIWLSTVMMFGNFSLSHTHLPVTSQSLHWVEYGLVHTMDIQPSWWCDWWMGYLNYQIEHHLFPTMPQFRHRYIRDRVKALAAKHGIPYNCVSYGEAVRITYQNLAKVSKELQSENP